MPRNDSTPETKDGPAPDPTPTPPKEETAPTPATVESTSAKEEEDTPAERARQRREDRLKERSNDEQDTPAASSLEQRREQRQAARDDARASQQERDSQTLLKTLPTEITAVDHLGVERLVTQVAVYEPPQVEPDPREVERLAAVNKRLDNQKQERLKALGAS